MTELDQAMRDRADRLAPLPLDLDAIMDEGDRRLRRRRTAILASAVAGVVAVAGVGVGLSALVGGDEPRASVASAPALPDQASYAVGSVLHRGAETVDVGRTVRALVLTVDGAVFTDPEGRVAALTGDGRVVDLGTARSGDFARLLAATEDGARVAWIDRLDGQPQLASYDVAGERVTLTPLPDGGEPRLVAADGAATYAWTGSDLVRVTDGGVEVVKKNADVDLVVEAGGGLLARTERTSDAGDFGVVLAPTLTADGVVLDGVNDIVLSPDARHAVSDDDDEAWLFDTATGERRDLRLPGYFFLAPVGFVDDDTVTAVAIEREDSTVASIATCEVGTAACTVVAADVGTYDPLEFALVGGLDLGRE